MSNAVEESGSRDNGGAVLVIVEYRNVQRSSQFFLDFETLGCLDVLKVDAPKRWLQQLADPNYLLRVLSRKLNIENVNISKALEEYRLPFHDRLTRGGTDVAQAQHCRAICHDGNQVCLRGVFIDQVRIAMDFKTRDSDAWCVRQAQVPLGQTRFRRRYGDLPRRRRGMVLQSVFVADHVNNSQPASSACRCERNGPNTLACGSFLFGGTRPEGCNRRAIAIGCGKSFWL